MDAVAITAIAEVLKLVIVSVNGYMQAQGATPEQIETMYTAVFDEVLKNDPANLPN